MSTPETTVFKHTRSALTNGKRPFLLPLKGNSVLSRRYIDIKRSLISRIDGEVTPYQRTMIESAASIQVQLELLRMKQVESEAVDSHLLLKLSNSLRRHLRDLSLAEDGDGT